MAQREDTIDIDALLNRIFRESRLQDLEVQDVVREIDTPTTTSESDDEPTVTQDGEWNVAQRFLNTTVTPSIQCEYSALYNDPAYQRRARLKLHNAKESFRIRTRQDTITVMDSQYYRDTLVHLYQKYPITGGREDLYAELIIKGETSLVERIEWRPDIQNWLSLTGIQRVNVVYAMTGSI